MHVFENRYVKFPFIAECDFFSQIPSLDFNMAPFLFFISSSHSSYNSQIEDISGTLVLRWVNAKLGRILEWVERAIQQEVLPLNFHVQQL